MSRIVTIVQARSGSSRLPGKSLKALAGRPMILHVMERAAAMGWPAWLATTLLSTDDALAHEVIRAGFPVFRGDERDVLGRMLETALAAQADVVVRVTGDCPCFAPDVGARVVAVYQAHGDGIATNDTTASGWPDGLDVEVFATAFLQASDKAVTRPGLDDGMERRSADRLWRDREHVTPWMRRKGPHRVLTSADDWTSVKLSVDEPADFERVRSVMAELNGGGLDWSATRDAYRRWQAKETR